MYNVHLLESYWSFRSDLALALQKIRERAFFAIGLLYDLSFLLRVTLTLLLVIVPVYVFESYRKAVYSTQQSSVEQDLSIRSKVTVLQLRPTGHVERRLSDG